MCSEDSLQPSGLFGRLGSPPRRPLSSQRGSLAPSSIPRAPGPWATFQDSISGLPFTGQPKVNGNFGSTVTRTPPSTWFFAVYRVFSRSLVLSFSQGSVMYSAWRRLPGARGCSTRLKQGRITVCEGRAGPVGYFSFSKSIDYRHSMRIIFVFNIIVPVTLSTPKPSHCWISNYPPASEVTKKKKKKNRSGLGHIQHHVLEMALVGLLLILIKPVPFCPILVFEPPQLP